jgi:hypothetical protein
VSTPYVAADESAEPSRSWLAEAGRGLSAILPPLALTVVVLVLWEAAIRLFKVPAFVLPAPSAIVVSLVESRAALMVAAKATAIEVLFGFVLAAVVGIAVALVIVRFERFGRALYPLVVLFQTVPKVALAPIFILWFGYDLAPKILLIVVIAFFPVAIDMLAGLQSVEPSFVALMRSHSAFAAASDGGPQSRDHVQRDRRHRRRVCRRVRRSWLYDPVRIHAARYAAGLRRAGRGVDTRARFLLSGRTCRTPFGTVGAKIRPHASLRTK